MLHDVFISYTNKDAKWAKKLNDSLVARGIKEERVFFAPDRIDIGNAWEKKLEDALFDSQNLILLWSDNAAKSDWVKREASGFQAHIHADDRNGEPKNRKLLQVYLNGNFEAFSAWQAWDLSKDQRHKFSEGADNADQGLWSEIVDKLVNAMQLSVNARPLLQVVLAATREEMSKLDFDKVPATSEKSLSDVVKELGITRENLLERYGKERGEWRPFQGEKNILAILGELQSELLEFGASPFLWQPIGQQFWTLGIETPVFSKLVNAIARQPCVIVIDVLSLYCTEVSSRYAALNACIRNTNAAIMVLPPISYASRMGLHGTLRNRMLAYYQLYFNLEWGLAETQLAQCNLLTPDRYEMRRLLIKAVNQAKTHWATSTAATK